MHLPSNVLCINAAFTHFNSILFFTSDWVDEAAHRYLEKVRLLTSSLINPNMVFWGQYDPHLNFPYLHMHIIPALSTSQLN